jgi:hypothetical protein
MDLNHISQLFVYFLVVFTCCDVTHSLYVPVVSILHFFIYLFIYLFYYFCILYYLFIFLGVFIHFLFELRPTYNLLLLKCLEILIS